MMYYQVLPSNLILNTNFMAKKISLVVFVLLAVVAAGCASNNLKEEKKVTTEPIKIGFVGPLSGDVANLGQNIRAAVEVARDEINNQGGINGRKIQVIFEDGKCDSKAATAAGNKLINLDKVKMIVGGVCSGETLAIAPMAEKNNVILISPASTNPKVTQAGDYVFRLIPSDSFQGKFAAEYMYNTLGKRSIAVLYTKNDWGVGVSNVFKKKIFETISVWS